jgi:hypothetical protein
MDGFESGSISLNFKSAFLNFGNAILDPFSAIQSRRVTTDFAFFFGVGFCAKNSVFGVILPLSLSFAGFGNPANFKIARV